MYTSTYINIVLENKKMNGKLILFI